MQVRSTTVLVLGVTTFAAATMLGCGSGTDATGDSPADAAHADEVAHDEHDHGAHGEPGHHEHGGWWCPEHGVPESECALCDTSLVASFKEQGDWCEEHQRPDSQCFLCDASRFDAFAARFEAKYGEQPPRPEEIAEAK